MRNHGTIINTIKFDDKMLIIPMICSLKRTMTKERGIKKENIRRAHQNEYPDFSTLTNIPALKILNTSKSKWVRQPNLST